MKLLDRLRNGLEIYSGRRAARVRGAVMLTAIGYRPDKTYIRRKVSKFGIAPEWTKSKNV